MMFFTRKCKQLYLSFTLNIFLKFVNSIILVKHLVQIADLVYDYLYYNKDFRLYSGV